MLRRAGSVSSRSIKASAKQSNPTYKSTAAATRDVSAAVAVTGYDGEVGKFAVCDVAPLLSTAATTVLTAGPASAGQWCRVDYRWRARWATLEQQAR